MSTDKSQAICKEYAMEISNLHAYTREVNYFLLKNGQLNNMNEKFLQLAISAPYTVSDLLADVDALAIQQVKMTARATLASQLLENKKPLNYPALHLTTKVTDYYYFRIRPFQEKILKLAEKLNNSRNFALTIRQLRVICKDMHQLNHQFKCYELRIEQLINRLSSWTSTKTR
jgi:hypothetical protein